MADQKQTGAVDERGGRSDDQHYHRDKHDTAGQQQTPLESRLEPGGLIHVLPGREI